MKRLIALPFLIVILLSITINQSNAELIDRGGGLIYDTVLDVTWLQDANYAQTSGYDSDGRMTWNEAVAWADSLEYGGFSNWRLPKTMPVNGSEYIYSPVYDGSTDSGYNISAPESAYPGSIGSEMAHLFYSTLKNIGFYDVDGNDFQPGYGLQNTGPFINLGAEDYWSGTQYLPVSTSAWDFDFDYGRQSDVGKTGDSNVYAWAVRDGDVRVCPKIYWTDVDTDKIQRANPDGSNIEDLVTNGLMNPSGIAVDMISDKIYWTDFNAGNGYIKRSNFDGTNTEDVVPTTEIGSQIEGIALDLDGGRIYWRQIGPAAIRRSNLDGSNIEDLVTTGFSTAGGINLDLDAGKMYWADSDFDKIQRANLDGTNIEDLVSTGFAGANFVVVDNVSNKMYWSDSGNNKIQRANFDGSAVEDLIVGLDDPHGIAIDPIGSKIYWADGGNGKIQRANLDGSNIEDLITGLGKPIGIALGDVCDNCPNDPNKTEPGVCGCGTSDIDSDTDGTPNCNDECPDDPNKIETGDCGCGVLETDTDTDGTPDCIDECPNDPDKVEEGVCGCGTPDTDTDNDLVLDCLDNCPNDPNKINPGICGCGIADTDSDQDGKADCNDDCNSLLDTDGDGVGDCDENCPNDPDKTEPGVCGCGLADTDSDQDGTPDCIDFQIIANITSPASNQKINVGKSVTFQCAVVGGNPPITYSWDFNGAVANTTQEDPGDVIFSEVGTYTVILAAADDDGDIDSDTVTITLKEASDGGGGGGGGGGSCFIDSIR
jgi:sugar lactone lactonase YvrE